MNQVTYTECERMVSQNWSEANCAAVPYGKKWIEQVSNGVKAVLASEPPLAPYSATQVLEALTYYFGFRGVTLAEIEPLMPTVSPEQRRKHYVNRLSEITRERQAQFLQSTGKCDEELHGLPRLDFGEMQIWGDVEQVMRPLVRSGITTFDRRYFENVRLTNEGHVGASARPRLEAAINYCVREQFLKKGKDGTYSLTPKARDFAAFVGAEFREPPEQEPDSVGKRANVVYS